MRCKWAQVQLSDIAELTVGFVGTMVEHYVDDGVIFLRSTNIEPFKINLNDVRFIPNEFHEQIRKSQLNPGDVVIVRTGKPGACAVIPQIKTSWNCSDLVIVRPDQEKVLPLYLASYINLAYGVINANLVGAVQQHFNVGSAKKLTVDLPPMAIQKCVVGIIQALNDKIELNQRINENLERQAQTIFAKEFLNIADVPEGWRIGNLLDIADYLNGLAMQKYRPKDGEAGLPVLKIKELRQGACDVSSELCSPSIKSEYVVHDGDVIFSWSGSLLVDFWCGGTCGLNQHLFKVTSKDYDKWFYYSWTLHHLNRFIAIAADKATTMGHIKREELAKAKTLIPSKSDYDRIGAVMGPIYDLIIANRLENRKLEEVRDSLLPKLLAGEIDIGSVNT